MSKLSEQQPSLTMILSVPCLSFLKELRSQLDVYADYGQLRRDILDDPTKHPGFSLAQNLILHKGRIWVPRDLPIIATLLQEYHATPIGGHVGVTKTLARLSENFYWSGLREDVTRFVANCMECQLIKYESKKSTGLLCPLSVPYRPWEDLLLDLIVGLPAY